MDSIVNYLLCNESLCLLCTVAVRREIKYEMYKLIYDVSEASITELVYKWLSYFRFL
jgi:hypothetical protein